MNLFDKVMYLRYCVKMIKVHAFKKFRNLDFEGRIQAVNPDFNGYEGCYPVKNILRKLDISNNDSILDIGCGKGLFLYYARSFKFKAIDGLEYSKEIFDIAKANVEKIADERIHLFNCDARQFENYVDYNFFFLCNPFSAEVMDAVVSKILESYKLRKRKLTVYYQFPFFKDVFTKNGFKLRHDTFLHGVLMYGE